MNRIQDLGDEDTAPANITSSDISTIAYSIRKDGASVASNTLTVADVVFDTLKTGGGWDYDSTGYNFRWLVAGSNFPSTGTYYIAITFTDTASNTFVVNWRIDVTGNGG